MTFSGLAHQYFRPKQAFNRTLMKDPHGNDNRRLQLLRLSFGLRTPVVATRGATTIGSRRGHESLKDSHWMLPGSRKAIISAMPARL
jgi:hypothetical protein